MAPGIDISWQFMAQETAHSGDFWFRILGPEMAKMVQFLGQENCWHMAISGSFIKMSVFLFHLYLDNI
jgi:hypothetical protein